MTAYDVAVLGLGGVGSAAAAELARRGLSVLGVDRYAPGHDRGASHGESRIIRSAYFEGATYVPLVRRAEQRWRALEAETGRALLRITGGLYVGRPDCELVAGSLRSAREHGVQHEILDAAELRRRIPVMRPDDDEDAVLEPGAGVLHPERGVLAHLDVARRYGADLRHGEPAARWEATARGVRLVTATGVHEAGALVVAAGAWSAGLLADLRIPLRVERRVQHWFAPAERGWSDAPVWIWQRPDGVTPYGFPLIGGACKLGLHDPPEEQPTVDPGALDRVVTAAEVAGVQHLLDPLLPSLASAEHVRSAACTYTLTPDEHFVVDRHPEHPHVAVAAGFSGHGYKFTPVLGELLADLVTGIAPPLDISAFRLGRAALAAR